MPLRQGQKSRPGQTALKHNDENVDWQHDSERIRSPSLCSQQSKHWCQILNGTWVTVSEARACATRRIGNPFLPSICAQPLQTPIPNMSPATTSVCVNVYPSHHNQALKFTSTNLFLKERRAVVFMGWMPLWNVKRQPSLKPRSLHGHLENRFDVGLKFPQISYLCSGHL